MHVHQRRCRDYAYVYAVAIVCGLVPADTGITNDVAEFGCRRPASTAT